MIHSSAVNLGVSYVLLGIAALVSFAAPLWYAWEVSIQEGRAEILQEDSQRLAEVFRRGGVSGLTHFITERVGLQIAGERILALRDGEGRSIAGNLGQWPAGLPELSGTYTLSVQLDGHPTRAVLVLTSLPGGFDLLVGRDLARYVPVEHRFWLGLAVAAAILLVVGTVGALMIRRELLARIQGIRRTVAAIVQGELSHRLVTAGSGDEFDTLSITINRMLDQIEQLVHGIRNVSNSIAHDLRTPLAELRSRLEELLVTRPPASETFAEVEGAVSDVDRVIRIFNALLRLAEIDAGLKRSGFVAVDLEAVAAEAVEFYLPAAEQKGVSLSFEGSGPAALSGDPLLLAQALGNLIDNGVKYAGSGGLVAIRVGRGEAGAIELIVDDDGPGIPDSDKSRATERFFRGDGSRGTPGVGLGLSIVEAVVRLHGGDLTLSDRTPGLRVCLRIPAIRPAEELLTARGRIVGAASPGTPSGGPEALSAVRSQAS